MPQEFARAGARVVAADIDGDAAKAVAAGSERARRATALGLETDIAGRGVDQRRWRRPRSTASARIDVLINNASLMSVLPRRSWLEIPVEEWDRVMAVNLRGMFLCCRAVFPAMKRAERGKIVNISSSAGVGGHAQPAALHDVEGRRDRLHPGARARGRRVRHHGERGHAGHDAERDAGRDHIRKLSGAARSPAARIERDQYPRTSSAR